ncbi:hypothetical protein CISIN_1g0219952mg, partial [Citrus sinensis]
MAMKRVASSAINAFASSGFLRSSSRFSRHYASSGSKKIVGVFYKGNEYASMNPNFL